MRNVELREVVPLVGVAVVVRRLAHALREPEPEGPEDALQAHEDAERQGARDAEARGTQRRGRDSLRVEVAHLVVAEPAEDQAAGREEQRQRPAAFI